MYINIYIQNMQLTIKVEFAHEHVELFGREVDVSLQQYSF